MHVYLLFPCYFHSGSDGVPCIPLPFLIGDVTEDEDRKWKCFILLLKITSICSAYEIEGACSCPKNSHRRASHAI